MDFTPESGTITMFSTTWCGYCNRLKKQLDAQGIGYTEINIEEVEGTADLVEQLNGGNRTVPTVLFPDGTAATNPSAAEVKNRLAANGLIKGSRPGTWGARPSVCLGIPHPAARAASRAGRRSPRSPAARTRRKY